MAALERVERHRALVKQLVESGLLQAIFEASREELCEQWLESESPEQREILHATARAVDSVEAQFALITERVFANDRQ